MIRVFQPNAPEIGLAAASGMGAVPAFFSEPEHWAFGAMIITGLVFGAVFIEWSLGRRFKPINDFITYLREKEATAVVHAEKEEARLRAREDSIDTALKLAVTGREADRSAIRELRVNDARQQATLDDLVAEVKSLKNARRM